MRLFLILGIFDVLLVIGVAIWAFTRPQPVELDDARVAAMARTLNRMEALFGQLPCQPKLVVASLAEVMADEPGYTLTEVQRKAVVDAFGEKNVPGAGILTYYMAYYRIRRGDYPHVDLTLPPGMRPTSPPSMYCPASAEDIRVTLQSTALKDERGIVEYNHGQYTKEATLGQLNGRWFVFDLRIIRVSN